MAEEGAGQQEQREQGKQPEILDLKNHGAVYGRFLLASLPEAKISNIIDPDKTVKFNDLTASTLEERNYNPVFENFSFNERKEEWKEAPSFDNAYDQWRTGFTNLIVKIQDPNRLLALKAILSNDNKAKDFTVSDADALFNAFCKGESNITGFVDRVVTNLASSGEINPTNLQTLLPHLQWIASGLFGKNTASIAVTRVIELESALRNNKGQVIEIINSQKDRINAPTDDEKRALGLLRDSLPVSQEGEEIITIPVQETQPVVPFVPEADVIEPAPQSVAVPPDEEEKKEEDDDELPVAPLLQGSAEAEKLPKHNPFDVPEIFISTDWTIAERLGAKLGKDFLGPDAIRNAQQLIRAVVIDNKQPFANLEFRLDKAPAFIYTQEDIENALQNNEALFLRIEAMLKGGREVPLTLIEFRELFRKDPLGKMQTVVSSFIDNTYDWYKGEEFATQAGEIKLGWSLVKKDVLDGSTNTTWNDQEQLLKQYEAGLRRKGAKNVSIRRRTGAEAVYDELLYYVNTGERLLPDEYDCTQTRASNGQLVCIGDFGGSDGLIVGGVMLPEDSKDGKLLNLFKVGVCPSR